MRTVAMMTAMILKSMLPPMEREISSAACARSGGAGLGNFERVAIDRYDVENLAGLGRGVPRDPRVPERVAVLDARVARALVYPGFEYRGLADVQARHRTRYGPLSRPMPPDDAGHRARHPTTPLPP